MVIGVSFEVVLIKGIIVGMIVFIYLFICINGIGKVNGIFDGFMIFWFELKVYDIVMNVYGVVECFIKFNVLSVRVSIVSL